jgi:Spy/CpxP family protein refolding chaperone
VSVSASALANCSASEFWHQLQENMMTTQTLRKLLVVPAVALAATAFAAQPGNAADASTTNGAPGYGPGMMGGPGSGGGAPGIPGRGGPGYGRGSPSMMGGGYGGGYGMSQGMMDGGYGGYGMGPGMMGGGYGGYGMGPGMMGGGYGGYGMGPGMMGGGYGGYRLAAILNLTDAQQKKIQAIEDAHAKKQWDLMTTLHHEMLSAERNSDSNDVNVDAIMKGAKSIADTRLEMLRNRLETGKEIRAVLTQEQQHKLQQMRGWGWQ